jgi:hypothetical protein
MYMNDQPQRLKEEKRCPAHRIAAPRGGWERVKAPSDFFPSAPAENYVDTPKAAFAFPLLSMAALPWW